MPTKRVCRDEKEAAVFGGRCGTGFDFHLRLGAALGFVEIKSVLHFEIYFRDGII